MTELEQGAAAMREWFLALTKVGFSETEAATIIGVWLANMRSSDDH